MHEINYNLGRVKLPSFNLERERGKKRKKKQNGTNVDKRKKEAVFLSFFL